jgi:hypothetical protein
MLAEQGLYDSGHHEASRGHPERVDQQGTSHVCPPSTHLSRWEKISSGYRRVNGRIVEIRIRPMEVSPASFLPFYIALARDALETVNRFVLYLHGLALLP